jgi:beta-glucuronidase
MLYPVRNKYRSFIELNDFWNFKIDENKTGEKENWHCGFDSEIEIAVPGSWNEQLEEIGLLHYTGSAWYQKKVFIPSEFNGKRIVFRVGSADYNSKVWINGKFVGQNKSGFLPFEFDVSSVVVPGEETLIVLMVNNELDDETIPQGIRSEYYPKENRLRDETYPATRFDYSPFGGINRSVVIYSTAKEFIKNIKINTKISGGHKGIIDVNVDVEASGNYDVLFDLEKTTCEQKEPVDKKNTSAKASLVINNCRYWSNNDPFLYNLVVNLTVNGKNADEYRLPIGVREVKVEGNKLFLNGKEIYLKGFGKHEDFSIIGKGLFLPLIVKDFELLKWINANSFRTSHYPYSEELMYYADRKGILVIDEVPAVSLDFRYVNQKTLENHKEAVRRLVERDCNHPSVIIWAAGNEPNLVGEQSYYDGRGKKYWGELINYFREQDNTRPITVPNCTRAGVDDPVFEFCDIISLNRYYGWYEYPGRIEDAVKILGDEMDTIHSKFNKPFIFTEFGVDTVAGQHSTSDQMFTEEYQAKFLEEYIKLFKSKYYMIGEHVWNFADFRTPQHFRRVVMNLKGVFTRDRLPKLAAFRLKDLWK